METEPQIIAQYLEPGQVRLVYRHVVQLGERSRQLAEAAQCAADQGGFWALRQALYARTNRLVLDTEGELAAAVAEVGLDQAALDACLAAGTHRAAVQADADAARAEGIRSRPVFRIGTQTIIGAQPFAAFQRLIAASLP